jgi:large subunit ribosomal protein L20
MPLNRELIFKLAKGFRGRNKNCIRQARNRVEKALQHSYVSRKLKKREFRAEWITRTNAAAREHDVRTRLVMAAVAARVSLTIRPTGVQLRYSTLVSGLHEQNIQLNRKMLSELAMTEPFSFKALVDQVKQMKGL